MQVTRIFNIIHLDVNKVLVVIISAYFCVQVRDSLEKVRERMYGQLGGMQQSMEKLSQEIRVMNYVTCDWILRSPQLQLVNLNNNKIENQSIKIHFSLGCQLTTEKSGVRGEGQNNSNGEL